MRLAVIAGANSPGSVIPSVVAKITWLELSSGVYALRYKYNAFGRILNHCTLEQKWEEVAITTLEWKLATLPSQGVGEHLDFCFRSGQGMIHGNQSRFVGADTLPSLRWKTPQFALRAAISCTRFPACCLQYSRRLRDVRGCNVLVNS